MNTQIASAAEVQTAVSDEISKNVQQVSDIAELASNSAGELYKTSQELSELESHLYTSIRQFKVWSRNYWII